MNYPRFTCPRCARVIAVKAGRLCSHSVVPDGRDTCPLSWQRIPVVGVSDDDYLMRARFVAELALLVQDEDPHMVWDYLTALPAVEIQRLLMITLAGIPVDKRPGEIWGWVAKLPVAVRRVA